MNEDILERNLDSVENKLAQYKQNCLNRVFMAENIGSQKQLHDSDLSEEDLDDI
jgi:hypothetical protein